MTSQVLQKGLNIQLIGAGLILDGHNVLSATGSTGAAFLVPGADINGVLFTGAAPITVTADASTLTGTTLNATVTDSSLTSVGTLVALTVTAPIVGTTATQPPGDNSTKLASTAYVDAAVTAGGSLVWNEVVGATSMLVNNGYVANNSSLVVLTLPAAAAFGQRVRVVGKGAGGWQIAQNAGQVVHFGTQTTTVGVGGSLQSQATFDAIELLCTTANTNWTEISAQGNITLT